MYEEDSFLTFQHRAMAQSNCLWDRFRGWHHRRSRDGPHIPKTSTERLYPSMSTDENHETVLYLAYGSNLSVETFRGNRGIKPLSQTNVQIPELKLTFDLPGIAYVEPCFANTARRDPDADVPKVMLEHETLQTNDYHKDRWHKGLIGVVYEVTVADYAHIIATEGGGAAYQDVQVDCYPFTSSDPAEAVPQFPTTRPFKAHTLFAPARTEPLRYVQDSGRLQRPDTSYAQPSARYLTLITDGAAECLLPYEYQDYLNDIRPYTVTSNKQRIGQFVFLTIWLPIVMFIFALQRSFSDEKGVAPMWLKVLSGAMFQASWSSYDSYFKGIFGDGERTTPKAEDDDWSGLQSSQKCKLLGRSRVDLSEKGLLEV
ncbi:hypothetical protein AAFC00_003593 [Neodothiora populina]